MAGVCGPSWLVILLACLALWTFCWWDLVLKKIFFEGLHAFVGGGGE